MEGIVGARTPHNPPSFYVLLYQAAMRAYHREPHPPVFQLYAGSQSLEIARPDVRTLELHAARGWCATQFEGFRDLKRSPFRVGDRFALAHLTVEVREVDARDAPTRARFTFDHPLDAPELTFRNWDKSNVATWTPPPVGSRLQLSAASTPTTGSCWAQSSTSSWPAKPETWSRQLRSRR